MEIKDKANNNLKNKPAEVIQSQSDWQRILLFLTEHKTLVLLLLILCLGIALRLLYAAEGVRMIATEFAREAVNIREGLYNPNLIYFHIGIRYVGILIYAVLISLFGVSETVMLSGPFIVSLLAIILTFIIGKKLFSEKVGLLAAFLLAIFPVDIFNATVVEADQFMALFTGLAMLCYIIAREKEGPHSLYYFFGTGVLLSVAFFTKIFAVLLFPILFLNEILTKKESETFFSIKFIIPLLLIAGGFLLVATPVFLYQYEKTGDLFYNIKVEKGIMHAITQFKTWPQPIFDFPSVPNLLGYPKQMFFFIPSEPWSKQFDEDSPMLHIYFIILFFAIFFYLLDRKKETDFLLCWLLLPLFFLEGYFFIVKLQRYLFIIFIPLTLLLSFFLFSLFQRIERRMVKQIISFLFFILMIFITCLQLGRPILISNNIYQGEHYHNDEEVFSILFKQLPEKDVYITHYDQIPIISFYMGYSKNFSGPYGYHGPTHTSFYDLHLVKNYSEIHDAYVLIDWFYFDPKIDLVERDPYQYYLMKNGSIAHLFQEQVPLSWSFVAELNGRYIFYAPP